MADILSVGISGIRTYQRALATVSNNIANADTEGYSRQRVETAEATSISLGTLNLGTGVRAVSVKRSYDEFVNQAFRHHSGKLDGLESLYRYTQKLEDIVGHEKIALTGTIDRFFAAAQAVAVSPATDSVRQELYYQAGAAVSHFHKIANEFKNLDVESLSDIRTRLGQLNSLSSELTSTNKALSRSGATADRQPNDLLDKRDLLLQKIAGYVEVTVEETTNGMVDVHLGTEKTGYKLVEGRNSIELGFEQNPDNPEEITFILSPYKEPRIVSNLHSGTLNGIVEFRENALTLAKGELDRIAQVFSTAVNEIQARGVSKSGNFGQRMFSMDNVFEVNPGINKGDAYVTVDVEGGQEVSKVRFEAKYLAETDQWQLTNKKSGDSAIGDREVVLDGVKAMFFGKSVDGDSFTLIPKKRSSEAIEMVLANRDEIASGGAIIATEAEGNKGVSEISLNNYTFEEKWPFNNGINTVLRNNDDRVAANNVVASNKLAFVIPAYMQDTSIYYTPAGGNDSIQTHVFTRDGRHLYGASLDESDQQSLISDINGFTSNAAYNTDYLNQSGSNAYLDQDFGYDHITDAASTVIQDASTENPPVQVFKLDEVAAAGDTLTFTVGSNTYSQEFVTDSETTLQSLADQIVAGESTVSSHEITHSGQQLILTGDDNTPFAENGLLSRTDSEISAFSIDKYLNEDLLVFVTGTGSAEMSARWGSLADVDPREKIRSEIDIVFNEEGNHYQLIDVETDTSIAEYDFSEGDTVARNGWEVSFNLAPTGGDRFSIKGNKDLTGDNRNVLSLVGLQNDRDVFDGQGDFAEVYASMVNNIGNIVVQASINRDVQEVLAKEAEDTRDSVSAVNLDEEAANLLRFQQAYQASAKVIGAANKIFDTILNL